MVRGAVVMTRDMIVMSKDKRLLVFDIAHSLLKHPLITHTNGIHDAFDTAELQGG